MTDDSKPTRHQIAQDLREAKRHPVASADRFQRTKDMPEAFEAVHLASNGSITLTYELESTVEGTLAGQVVEFDLMEDDDETE